MVLVRGAADELSKHRQADEEDLGLARDAAAFYLKLSESVLAQTPGHLALAETVTGGFTQYAYVFIGFEAERLADKDARAAQRLRQRAARMYWRAQRHGLAALEHDQPGFMKALAAGTLSLKPAHVGLAYWTAASWSAAISLSKDRPEAVADLPLAMRLARLAWEREPRHGEGALASLMGTLEAARPGGNRHEAVGYFDTALEAGGGLNAGVFVAKAEAIAAPSGDRVAFEGLLRQALAASIARHDLANEAMRERAQWLLETVDDRF
jgi:predicted anti-sigma-YlaC factor YlaD